MPMSMSIIFMPIVTSYADANVRRTTSDLMMLLLIYDIDTAVMKLVPMPKVLMQMFGVSMSVNAASAEVQFK